MQAEKRAVPVQTKFTTDAETTSEADDAQRKAKQIPRTMRK
ncbi:MAG: hypothetical protein ABSA81_03910 [Candidatus Bathyarchaeia archaeon]